MQNRRFVLALLVMLPILFGAILAPSMYSINNGPNEIASDSPDVIDTRARDVETHDAFALSQDTKEGIINPIQIRESGFQETDPVRARTDTGTNTNQNITIDDSNDWFANSTSVEVSNVKRLYGVNGTFEEGVDPWTVYTIDGGSNIQIADYDDDGEYIICRNVGDYKKIASQHYWTHSQNSEIGWEQTVDNPQGLLEFNMRLDFRYATGPIDPEGDNGFFGDIGVFYQISNGGTLDAWYFPMETNVDSRDAWYSLDHDFTLPAAWSSFEIAVGLWLAWDVELNNATDYDDDPLGLPDGTEHTQNLTLYLDNVEFTSIAVPSFESVDLTFHAGTFSEAITGSGYGEATITNPSFWTVDPLDIQITSNTSVAFTYTVTTNYHRLINSSWTTYLSEHGVSYSIDAGQSADLEFFTYVTASSVYDNQTIEIEFPEDWENKTVWDPLQNDITGLCTITSGSIFVPNSLFDRVGWWKITHQSLNYAKEIAVQIYDTGMWTSSTIFRPSNLTRTQVELGTTTETPSIGNPVNIEWIMPNSTIWTTDSVSSIIGGFANSSTFTFGGMNTSAGVWEVQVFWNNGTELAYDYTNFQLYHSAIASAHYPLINSDYGLVIANQITLTDTDNGEYLLDDSVTMTANWSDTTVAFTQNYAKNWWQADFDTALIEGGEYTVVVSVSRPYFDPVSVQFSVICTFETTLEITNAGGIPIDRGLNEVFTVQMDYDFLNGTGILGADIYISHSGPGGGLSWDNFIDYNNGQYAVDITCTLSDTYPIEITLNKSYYYSASDTFTLIIGETGTSLTCLNGTSDVVLFGGNYTLVLEYLNSTSDGLTGATLAVEAVTPSIGLTYTSFAPIGNGLYNITLIPNEAGTFSVVMSASLLNHETQYITFTITATGIPTVLTAIPSSETIAVDQIFVVQLRFQDIGSNPISFENVSVLNFPSGLLISDVVPIAGGLYNFTLTPLQIGTFDIIFRGTAENYQSSSAAFTLFVTDIPTHLVFEGDVSSTTVEFQEPYQLTVYYYRSDATTPTNVEAADVSVIVQDPGLVIDVEEFVGYYVITIRGESIGTWSLTITADKADHHLSTKQFLFEVEEIDTSVAGSTPLESLLFGRSYDFSFEYIFESNSSYIRGADIFPSGEGSDWISFIEQGTGIYLVNLNPQSLGEHSVVLSFEKYGFDTATFRLTFNVTRVPISVEIVQGLIAPETSMSTIIVRITESDTGTPVGGIQVYCRIKNPSGVTIATITLVETATTGEYTGQFLMPEAEGVFQIEVVCEASHYVLSNAYSMNLQPERDLGTMLWVTTTRYYPIIIALAAVFVGIAYRRSARKKRIRENKATLAIKRRFDDIRSLMGVIVLHKDSGLPIYSKILRDGLEETVISAFITAITSFRGEFDIESSSEEWGLIPISDIVRVISTNRLVCAFITTGNPSPEQRERMIQFAKTVGFIFDDTMSEVPIVVLDHHTTMQFDSLFEDLLDGQLLRTYRLDDEKKLPTTSCASERIARKHGEEFKLEELASEIASCGLEEGRVYKAIMEALENHFLVTTDDSPFATELLRAPDTVSEEG
ncbi:hypothetical protein EU528_03550 [Candidatus Thorarchaeota archaeon]|nr:MAG: hypothetical protein EU528_03550 [Candidatus Thorarchaeota archaeon]